MGTVDRRLLPYWEASWRRERASRMLPAEWLADERAEAQVVNELWIDMLADRLDDHAALADRDA